MTEPVSKEELREQFLQQVRLLAQYWAAQPNLSIDERCDGVAFSILNIIDGSSMGLPAFDLVARPHPDDKAYDIANGDKYIEDGTVINDDCELHDMYYRH